MQNPVSWLEIFSIVASLVSIGLGGLAIWLAVKFYELSTKSADKLEKSSSDIESATKRLEILFEKLYADTFSMVKDTVSDMRKHVWRKEETEGSLSDERVLALKSELLEEINSNFKKLSGDFQQEDLSNKIKSIVEKAVNKTAEISQKPTSEQVLSAIERLWETGASVTYSAIANRLGVADNDVVGTLFSLRGAGKISWGDPKRKSEISSIDQIYIVDAKNS
ncbi:MAG: hypothetical protein Q7U82_15225 [Gammaproteobacteria bacterium]|nr:hypothetical protein [Gammaproteobacteria bacterium]